jgi:dihydroorotase
VGVSSIRKTVSTREWMSLSNGKIARVAAAIPAAEARKVVNVSGLLVTPGLIDTHVHVYQGPEKRLLERDSRVQPDAHTFRSGVTTVVDAGTTGWRTFAWLARACLLLLTFLRPVGIATAQKYLIQM